LNIELRYASDCPRVQEVRDALHRSLDRLGLSLPVRETETGGPSPVLQINGVDVLGEAVGEPPTTGRSCRLRVPTEEHITAALISYREA
jgi:hypothetical protein